MPSNEISRQRITRRVVLNLTVGALFGAGIVRPVPEEPLLDIQPPDPKRHINYSLAHVQFKDEGAFRDPKQVEQVLQYAKSVSENGIALVVFMHGWNNNCDRCNGNLLCFTEVLKALAEFENEYSLGAPPHVMGIYLSWRGKTLAPSLANQLLTFSNRYETAQAIGKAGPLRNFLLRLGKVKADAPEGTRRILVVSGHSLGARALFYALKEKDILEPLRTSNARGAIPGGSAPAIVGSDLVLLLNPAISVREFSEVDRLAATTTPAATPPNLVIAAAANDPVTRIAYRLDRALRLQFGAEDYSTIGNWPQYFTDELEATGELPKPANLARQACQCSEMEAESLRKGWDGQTDYRQIDKEKYQLTLTGTGVHRVSCMVVRVGESVMPGHGRIYTPAFFDYLIRLVNARLQNQVPAALRDET